MSITILYAFHLLGEGQQKTTGSVHLYRILDIKLKKGNWGLLKYFYHIGDTLYSVVHENAKEETIKRRIKMGGYLFDTCTITSMFSAI